MFYNLKSIAQIYQKYIFAYSLNHDEPNYDLAWYMKKLIQVQVIFLTSFGYLISLVHSLKIIILLLVNMYDVQLPTISSSSQAKTKETIQCNKNKEQKSMQKVKKRRGQQQKLSYPWKILHPS